MDKWKLLLENVFCLVHMERWVAVPHEITRGPAGSPLEAAPAFFKGSRGSESRNRYL